MKGFSSNNLMYMRDFAATWPDAEFVQQTAAQLPWFHIVVRITRLKDGPTREWYARRAISEGWPRVTLELNIRNRLHEREIENAVVWHITQFLLELGSGFALIGRQFRLEVEGDEFLVDLLFYHTRLKCYVVVELKATAFKPAHAFYLIAVDR